MTDTIDWDDDILGEDEAEDYIIELTDIINDDSKQTTEEDLIELTDVVKEESFEEEENLELEVDEPDDDLLIEPEEANDESFQDMDVSQEQVEAVLERVIEKKFADKIDSILFEVMERIIKKEIIEIKESLQKDLDQIGNA